MAALISPPVAMSACTLALQMMKPTVLSWSSCCCKRTAGAWSCEAGDDAWGQTVPLHTDGPVRLWYQPLFSEWENFNKYFFILLTSVFVTNIIKLTSHTGSNSIYEFLHKNINKLINSHNVTLIGKDIRRAISVTLTYPNKFQCDQVYFTCPFKAFEVSYLNKDKWDYFLASVWACW